jgi:hypothetical protein
MPRALAIPELCGFRVISLRIYLDYDEHVGAAEFSVAPERQARVLIAKAGRKNPLAPLETHPPTLLMPLPRRLVI